MMVRRFVVALLTAGLAATGVASASNGTQRVHVQTFGGSYELSVDCADFGPYGFEVVVDGADRGTITDVYDKDGALLRTEMHIQLDETNTNSVTGKQLTLKGNARVVWDWVAGVRTLTGIAWMGKTSDGTTFQDTGRIEISLDTSEALFVGGPHDVFFGGGIDAMACVALAGS